MASAGAIHVIVLMRRTVRDWPGRGRDRGAFPARSLHVPEGIADAARVKAPQIESEGSLSIVAMARYGAVLARYGGFARRADVFCAGALEDLLRPLRLLGVLRMDGDQ